MGGKLSAAALSAATLAALILLGAPARAEAPREAEREALRGEWHACVKQAFSSQPPNADKQAAQRAALARCKPAENAVVAAELAIQQDAEEARRKAGLTSGGLTSRARAWMSSVAGTVVDPVLAWIGR